jgi:hypothetical protein
LGASKIISEPMVHLAQTVHLSCTDTNTVYKRTKTRFHMTQVTKELHWVRPKQFLSLWYVRRKACTYLASRLALSRNSLNQLLVEPRHLGLLSRAFKTIQSPWYIWHKPCTYLASRLALYPRNESSIHLSLVTRSTIVCIQTDF